MVYVGSILSLLALAGVAILLKWVYSQIATRRHAEGLTPEDLRVLETSAGHLVEEIKETAAVAVRDLDDRCEDLRKLILMADQKIALWAQLTQQPETPVAASQIETEALEDGSRVYELADAGMSPAEIARQTEMPVGEITLMLSLRSTARV